MATDFENFNYWLGRASDTLATIDATLGHNMSSAERAVLGSAMKRLDLITLAPARAWGAYNEGGWVNVAKSLGTDIGTGIIVTGVAGGAALMLPGLAGVALGISAGVVAGAALDYGISSIKGSKFFDKMLDRLTSDFTSGGGVTLPDGSTLLEPIIVHRYSRGDYDMAMESLSRAIDHANKSYSSGLTLDKILSLKGRSGGDDFYNSLSKREPEQLARGRPIEEAIEEVVDAYEANKAEIDAENPEIGKLVQNLKTALSGLGIASNFISPLVIDIGGDGIETLAIGAHHAAFDFNLDLPVAGHGWVSPKDGLLAIDTNTNGRIDNSSELFGGRDYDGFTMLERLDDNQDGIIDSKDASFGSLKIWVDANSDGVTDAGELQSLEHNGIASIDLKALVDPTFDNGNFVPLTSVVTKTTGETLQVADVYFATEEAGGSITAVSSPDSRVVLGSAQADLIEGSSKSQALFGGAEQDTFVFRKNFGSDIIVDFQIGAGTADRLQFEDGLFTDAKAVLAAARQVGDDTVITYDSNNSVTLKNVDLSSLYKDDGWFSG